MMKSQSHQFIKSILLDHGNPRDEKSTILQRHWRPYGYIRRAKYSLILVAKVFAMRNYLDVTNPQTNSLIVSFYETFFYTRSKS